MDAVAPGFFIDVAFFYGSLRANHQQIISPRKIRVFCVWFRDSAAQFLLNQAGSRNYCAVDAWARRSQVLLLESGSRMLTRSPEVFKFSQATVPPHDSTQVFTMDKPKPVPPVSRVREESTR